MVFLFQIIKEQQNKDAENATIFFSIRKKIGIKKACKSTPVRSQMKLVKKWRGQKEKEIKNQLQYFIFTLFLYFFRGVGKGNIGDEWHKKRK